MIDTTRLYIAAFGSVTAPIYQPPHHWGASDGPARGAHTLDLLLTNNPDRISNVRVVDGLPGADHEAVDFVVELAPPRSSA